MALPLNCPLCKKGNKYQSVVLKHVYGSPADKKVIFSNVKILI